MRVLRKLAESIVWVLCVIVIYSAFSAAVEVLAGSDIEFKRHLQCLGGLAVLAAVAAVQQYQIHKLRSEIEKAKRAE